jgi:hypothetical protein
MNELQWFRPVFGPQFLGTLIEQVSFSAPFNFQGVNTGGPRKGLRRLSGSEVIGDHRRI